MKSLAELHELREKLQKDIETRNNDNKPKIIIGMGTCGIAAGARDILKTVLKEIKKRGVNTTVTQTGCIGMCEKEPLLEVEMPGQERITYGNLQPGDVKRIIVEHVINDNIVQDLVIARHEKGGL